VKGVSEQLCVAYLPSVGGLNHDTVEERTLICYYLVTGRYYRENAYIDQNVWIYLSSTAYYCLQELPQFYEVISDYVHITANK